MLVMKSLTTPLLAIVTAPVVRAPCICTKRMWRCEDFLKLTAQFEKAVINSISNPDEELQRELTIELIAEVIIKVRNDRLSQRVERERRKIPSIL